MEPPGRRPLLDQQADQQTDPPAARSGRGRLSERLTRATPHLPGPVAVVDLDLFDANAAGLLRRAGSTPVRLASKSVRVRALVHRALEEAGVAETTGREPTFERVRLVAGGVATPTLVVAAVSRPTALGPQVGGPWPVP